jgi:hypothetical protein
MEEKLDAFSATYCSLHFFAIIKAIVDEIKTKPIEYHIFSTIKLRRKEYAEKNITNHLLSILLSIKEDMANNVVISNPYMIDMNEV